MKSYTLSEVLTDDQLADLLRIRDECESKHQPVQPALLRYINASPAILRNCDRLELLPAFFAWQLTALLPRSP